MMIGKVHRHKDTQGSDAAVPPSLVQIAVAREPSEDGRELLAREPAQEEFESMPVIRSFTERRS